MRIAALRGENRYALPRDYLGFILSRHLSMPSFVTGKRSGLVSLAAAGALVAGAISAATVTLSSTPSASASPAFANLHVAKPQLAAGQAAAAKAAAAERAAAQAQAKAKTQIQAKAQTQAKIQHQAAASPQQNAKAMLGQFGWSASQFSCLNPLWAHESGWSVTATNAGSGAYGIPQALPGSKMGSADPNWQANAATQIRWGLDYIQGTYGSPCAAWSHEQSDGWY